MDAEPVTIPADAAAAGAYEDYFLRYQGWEWFAVVDADGRFVGIAHREPLRQVAEAGGDRPVGELVVPPATDGAGARRRAARGAAGAPSRCAASAR